MSQESNKAVVRRVLDDVFAGGKFDLLDELLQPDFVNHNILGTGEETHSVGIEAMKREMMGVHSSMSDISIEVVHLLADGDFVMTYAISKGTHSGQFFGIPGTGRPVRTPAMSIVRMADGKMAERWNIIDLYGTLQQIGAVPGPSRS
jgi:predicted ester cyclase